MKNRKIIGLSIIGILTTSSVAFANDIKVLTKDNIKYIPLKKIIQKSGGEVDILGDTAKVTIHGKSIVIEKNLSFAKVNNNYYPLDKEEINGIDVPVDTKPIFEKGEVYIEKDFLKDNKIANYKIEKDNVKIILEDKDKATPTQKVEIAKEDKNEEKDSQVNHETNDNSNESNNISRPTVTEKPSRPSVSEKPSRPIRPTKPNRPNNGGNSSNNNNNNNGGSVGNSGNNNSGGSEDNSGSNNGGNTGGENNSGSENNGNQASGQPTPETPNDQPSTSTVE